MNGELEVSFNSPQCGWMSIGFENGTGEFHTTTAAAPYSAALSEILTAVSRLADPADTEFERRLKWNRDPEEFDFVFRRSEGTGTIEIFAYPTDERTESEKSLVFSHSGDPRQIASAFYETFRQLYEERDTDDFRENWHQEFPYEAYRTLESRLTAA